MNKDNVNIQRSFVQFYIVMIGCNNNVVIYKFLSNHI